MHKVLVELTHELWSAIEAARGNAPRNPWLERQMWRLKSVRDAARGLGVEKPARPSDGRGRARKRKP